ncbi:MAG: ABC transporter permease [Bdellovibrionales bacterium]|nr:ABC transporter permease [Bdellovibrionales bacterium]
MKRQHLKLFLGFFILLIFLCLAVFASQISSQNPNEIHLENRYQAPSFSHLLGLDENGSDVFTKVAYGARVSLGVALSVVFISLMIGLIVGSLSGFYGGWTDHLAMRTIEIVQAFPNILLALAFISLSGPSLKNLILAMSLTGWAGFARLVRAEFLYLKQKEFIQSCTAIGASPLRKIVLHIWPTIWGTLFLNATFAMAGTIVAESGLSFLGLGVPLNTPSWGALLNAGRKILDEAPHVSLAAGGAIFFLVLSFYLIADGLRDQLDPRQTFS